VVGSVPKSVAEISATDCREDPKTRKIERPEDIELFGKFAREQKHFVAFRSLLRFGGSFRVLGS
jgi:hypothetical protein